MEFTQVSNLDLQISRITLGTWAIGGWMWGGTDERQSVQTILAALDQRITTIDTAPVYGFGESESLVGQAVKEYGKREDLVLATKAGLEWDEKQKIRRNSSAERLKKEVNDSLQRLGTDYIDILQIHWPDHNTPFNETASTLAELQKAGKIRAIGVSNFSPEQMDEFRQTAPIHVCQPPYNLFERGIEEDIKPYCHEHNITMLTYGAICRGLLSGKMTENMTFEGDDLRNVDPKFKGNRFKQYLAAVNELDAWSREKYDKQILHMAVRWILDKGVDSAIWGARKPEQVTIEEILGWHLSEEDFQEIDDIINQHVKDPVGPEFMAPPA